MNDENQNNLNNNVQNPNGQMPNSQAPNQQVPNQQVGFNPYAQSNNQYAQTNQNPYMDPNLASPMPNQQLNPNGTENQIQQPIMNSQEGQSQQQNNNFYDPSQGQTNTQPKESKQNPVKKHGMSIITTIVLLVLIAVAVLGGHFIYKSTHREQNKIHEKDFDTVNNSGELGRTKNESIKIGAIVSYTPDASDGYLVKAEYMGSGEDVIIKQNSNMYWKVFKVTEDTLEIIATVPTTETLTLSGAIGYDNGVFLLNDICKNLFSNSSMNAVGRSINIDDIVSKVPEDLIETVHYKAIDVRKTYTGANAYYPTIYMNENGSGIGKAQQYVEHSSLKANATADGTNDMNNIEIDYEEIIDVKTNGCSESDSWLSTPISKVGTEKGYKLANNQQFVATHTAFTSQTTGFSDDAYSSIIFGTTRQYWLASRYVNCYENEICTFGLRTVNSKTLEILKMFDSNGSEYTISYSVLPIVTIKNYKVKSGTGNVKDPIILEN